MAEPPPSGRPARATELGAAIDTLRRFNRSHTQRVGALDDSFLDTGRALGQSRLLFEIGPDGDVVADLRSRLGLDSGYLSRLLRHLEHDRLITVVPDPADGRRRRAELTAAGRRAWRDLDRRSDELATELVAALGDRQRGQLVGALELADRLLRAATIRFEIVDPESDAALHAMSRYFDELDVRFDTGFDPGDTLTADAPGFRPPGGAFVVASSDGATVACGGVQRIDPTTAEIKRMWVAEDWRGVGLGARMLRELERTAAGLDHHRVVLDTNASLLEAIAMYERAGYRPIERYNDNPYAQRWFEADLDRPG